jgi:hypothetical protein
VEVVLEFGVSIGQWLWKISVGGFRSGRGSLSQLEKARPGSQATISTGARLLPSGKRFDLSPVTAAKLLIVLGSLAVSHRKCEHPFSRH